ncbi:MAG TPA: DUF6766 family protein [Nannocystaceae bacterium]|nr:DUF6766 family protein [Nannocystaceae bacterium]
MNAQTVRQPPRSRLLRVLYENSLLLVVTLMLLGSLAGQLATGKVVYDEELAELGHAPLSVRDYLRSGHALEATFENWESEFLQMGMYVLLTVWLRQRGSSESKKLYERAEVDREPDPHRPGAPWPVRRGGVVGRLYAHSLSIAFASLFAVSVWLHARGGAEVESIERRARGESAISTFEYLGEAKFWFESLQNWQSEFLSIVAIVSLSIFLREHGSPESKPVDCPHAETEE